MSASERITRDLYSLSEDLIRAGHETTGGLFGGEFGYGAFVDNDAFMMRPYCWCERFDCQWCAPCECPEDAVLYFIGDEDLSGEAFYERGGHRNRDARQVQVREKECANCRRGPDRFAPNFLHKRTGTAIRWYKYIGRGMEYDLLGKWPEIIRECQDAVSAAPLGDNMGDSATRPTT